MKVITEVDVQLTPADLARAFWGLDDAGQADFFNALGRLPIESFTLLTQMAFVADHDFLSKRGRETMKLIGEAVAV